MNKEIFEQAVRELSASTGKSLKESRDILESAVDILKMEKQRFGKSVVSGEMKA